MKTTQLAPAFVLVSAVFGAAAACSSSTPSGDGFTARPDSGSPSSSPTTPTPSPTTTLPGASSEGGSTPVADSGSAPTTPTTAVAAGAALVTASGCHTCHGADLSGNIKQSSGVYSANITPDMTTGIGSWTLTNLVMALRDSTDDQGQPICSTMPKFPLLSDDNIVDIYAYLQSIPPVSKAQTNTDCQGNPDGDDDDDDDAGPDAATDAGADSGPDASDPCPHKVCTEGAPLAPSCGGCATAVCSHDPDCCAMGWSATCVSEVNKYCVTQCN